MKILIRVDAGDSIGLGHFFRSVALAKGLRVKGHQICFICHKSEFWSQKVEDGFDWKVYFISPNQTEIEVIEKGKFQLLFVDGNIDYSSEVASKIKSLVPICMYQNLTESRLFADVYILPSIHQDDKFLSKFNPSTKVYQGLSYFTFNDKLYQLSPIKLKTDLKRIGITSGGSDPKNILLSLYNRVKEIKELHNFQFVFFYGENYLHYESIPRTNEFFEFVKFDYNKILECDLVISTFGVSTYELMALGMPIITLGHQESTSLAAEFLSSHTQAFIHLGNIDYLEADKIADAIAIMIPYETRISKSNKALRFLDLKGFERVINIIKENFYAA